MEEYGENGVQNDPYYIYTKSISDSQSDSTLKDYECSASYSLAEFSARDGEKVDR